MPNSVTAESATADTHIYTCVVVHSIRRGSRHEKAWKGNLPWQRESQHGRQGNNHRMFTGSGWGGVGGRCTGRAMAGLGEDGQAIRLRARRPR